MTLQTDGTDKNGNYDILDEYLRGKHLRRLIDIGAWWGPWSLYWQSRAEKIEIFEPISISVFSQSTWDAIDQSYTIEFIIFGGTPPYEIVYNGNPVGDVVSGLNEGSHEFTITDQENCDTIVSIQLGENGLIEKDSIEFRVFPNPNSTGIFNILLFKLSN